MQETLKELSGDLQMIHQYLEDAEAVERQLGKYWREFEEERDQFRIALENHNSGSKQLAKWLEESRLEEMKAKRQAASDRARVRMMRVDLKQLLEGHRKHGITGLFLDIEEFLQKVVELDR